MRLSLIFTTLICLASAGCKTGTCRFPLLARPCFDTKPPWSVRIAGSMRIQIYIIALLLSAIMWSISFDAARESYHAAQSAGLMPNLHINKKLDRIL
ncbi:hypothetical protein GGI59_001014 [Rhizobium lentis]|uniref:Uncharacterized protein n=1 Tax=Rhizobium lentis TaxID=1138194 RepID=A0A7W8UJY2_9HYPH|nr:hypothetical protein [Rhizobium lentis]MBB5548854.1 hypothetical protein [Rhizobium lentis]MBB5559387.1 hypothetical protein [Rhizobium lentis]MBB5565091.1 hypothetical protein [Rhizobium lentis]